MRLPTNMRVRNRAIILVLLPATIFFWLIGWSLFWTSSQNKPQRPEPTTEANTPITTAVLLEDPQECKT